MSIKVFQTNEKGKIEFTRCELEKLLTETYKEGCRDAEYRAKKDYWTWTSPEVGYGLTTSHSDTISSATTTTTAINNKNCNTISGAIETKADKAVNCSSPKAKTYEIRISKDALPIDLSSLSQAIDEILNGNIAAPIPNDHFANLAKELKNL